MNVELEGEEDDVDPMLDEDEEDPSEDVIDELVIEEVEAIEVVELEDEFGSVNA